MINVKKPILFLTDETESAEPSLQNVAGIKVKAHAREGAPGCNCDRWGHPCPDCDERKIPTEGGASDFITSQKTKLNPWNT
jgi:hypothetical protein